MGAAGVQSQPGTRKRRPTPRRKRASGFGPWEVLNGASGQKYVMVNKGGAMGVPYYRSLGYEFVRWQGTTGEGESEKAKGPYIAGGRPWNEMKVGEIQEFMDHVLMGISQEDHEEIEQFGPFGNTGQEHCDEIEKRIRTKRGVDRDPLSGLDLGRDEPIAYLAKNADEQGDPF